MNPNTHDAAVAQDAQSRGEDGNGRMGNWEIGMVREEREQQRLWTNDLEESRRGDDVNGPKSFQAGQRFIAGHQVRGLRFYSGGKNHQIVRVLNGGRYGCCSRNYYGGPCQQGHKIMNVLSREMVVNVNFREAQGFLELN